MNEQWFDDGMEILIKRDRDFAAIIKEYGKPTQWKRKPGFPTLIQIILEQQVSLSSAKATFRRLNETIKELNPECFLGLDDGQLKAIGFSRQKTLYGRELATAIITNKLDLNNLERFDDLTIRQKLKQIKGIGDWTVDMYLMMALQRPDIFPTKDLAVVTAIKEIKQLPTRPSVDKLELIATAWQPYRAIATMVLWHYYLHRK